MSWNTLEPEHRTTVRRWRVLNCGCKQKHVRGEWVTYALCARNNTPEYFFRHERFTSGTYHPDVKPKEYGYHVG